MAEKKPLIKSAHSTVGNDLKNRRSQLGFSLQDVELSTKIRGKYLRAIEADRHSELPHDVYTRGFVQTYANHLGLKGAAIARRYMAERGDRAPKIDRPKSVETPRVIFSPGRAAALSVLAILAAVVTYIVWQFSALVGSPKLEVTTPAADQVLYGSLLDVKGRSAAGADVFVNDSPILSDGDGNFTDSIALQDGLNTIKVSAKNRLGKTTTITRNILAHLPKTDPASVLPPAPFDGVAVQVGVQGSTTAISVTVDGKQTFRGTMLPGTIQTFKGLNKIVLETSNAGATSLAVTNTVVAGKSLGKLGENGKARKDLEFAKDTQFQ